MVCARLFLEKNRVVLCQRHVLIHADKYTCTVAELLEYTESFHGQGDEQIIMEPGPARGNRVKPVATRKGTKVISSLVGKALPRP